YAATKLPKNSVGTAQIKNKAVTKAKLAAGVAVSGAKGDVGPKGDTGAAGAPGAGGTAGTAGAPGKDGANAATTVVMHRAIQPVAMNTQGTATAACNAGERMISGGGGWVNSISE